jgi:RNA polymerase sigma-70 factor (ECF subfamily)
MACSSDAAGKSFSQATKQTVAQTWDPEILVSVIDRDIVTCLPNLRAYARALARNVDQADDLVQSSIVRALSAASQYQPGTNFKAWMFTILRNGYFNELRHNRGITRPIEAADLEAYSTPANQQAGLEFGDFHRVFSQLPAEQREALVLVGAEGYAYGEAAAICKCPIGTIKSRVGRARSELKRMITMGEIPARRRSKPRAVFLPGAVPARAV